MMINKKNGNTANNELEEENHILIKQQTDNTDNIEENSQHQKFNWVEFTPAGRSLISETANGRPNCYTAMLPYELNIFSNLPASVFSQVNVGEFLSNLENVLKDAYYKSRLENLSLPKLSIGEHSNFSLVLDWVFNYFQMYFSFDDNDGNFWGTVMAGNDEGEFFNSVIRLRPGKENEQAQTILDNVLMLLG